MRETGHQPILFVSALAGAENVARTMAEACRCEVRVARTAKSALATLRREEFAVVLVDQSTIPGETAERIIQRSGLATLLEMPVRDVGAERLLRELHGVLRLRAVNAQKAREEAAHAVQEELREDLAALVLHADLMMRERSLPPALARKLETLHSLTDALRVRLRSA